MSEWHLEVEYIPPEMSGLKGKKRITGPVEQINKNHGCGYEGQDMSRIDDVQRLKELEAKATPAKWIDESNYVVTLDEIDIDGEGDRQIEVPYDVDDAVFISQMRNAARYLLAVAGQFQAGDAERLELLILNEQQRWTDERWQAAIDCLRRMLAAARIMEGDE